MTATEWLTKFLRPEMGVPPTASAHTSKVQQFAARLGITMGPDDQLSILATNMILLDRIEAIEAEMKRQRGDPLA